MIRQPDFFASEKQKRVISIGFASFQAKLLLKLQEEYGKIWMTMCGNGFRNPCFAAILPIITIPILILPREAGLFCFYTSQGLLIPNVYIDFIYQTVRLASDDFAAIAEGSPVSEAEALEPGIRMIRETRQNKEGKSPETLRANLLLTDGLMYLYYETGEDGELRLTEKRMYFTFMRFVYCKYIDGKPVEWLDRDTHWELECPDCKLPDGWLMYTELNATVLKEDMV